MAEPTNKQLAVLNRALAKTGLERLAQAIHKDESVVSRIRSGQGNASLEDFVRLLNAAGLRLVPAETRCVDGDVFDAVSLLAARAMTCPETVKRLMNSEDES